MLSKEDDDDIHQGTKEFEPSNRKQWQDDYEDTILGIAIPDLPTMTGAIPTDEGEHRQRSPIPELSSLAHVGSVQRLVTTPVSASTGTPSTFYSESVGPWSSRNTTPMSMSYSPGIIQTATMGQGPRLASPFRGRTLRTPDPVTLPSIGSKKVEGSSSPAREKTRVKTPQRKLTKRSLKDTTPPPGLSPPPRKSSMKFRSPSNKSIVDESTGSPQARRRRDVSVESRAAEVEPLRPHRSANEEPLRPRRPTDDEPPRLHKSTDDEPLRSRRLTDDEARSRRPADDEPRPRRPSRQGTTRLDVEATPVVQSDLPAGSLKNHRKRVSSAGDNQKYLGHMAPTLSSANKIQPSVAPRSVSARRSPSIGPPSSSTRVEQRKEQKITPPTGIPTISQTTRRESESSTRSDKSTKFSLFGRKKTKSEPELAPLGKRAPRKGPAAGTGHEGYGKYAQRGRRTSSGSVTSSQERSGSIAASTTRSVSSWKTSNPSGSESELDEFVSQRLDPIIIPGGGGSISRLSLMDKQGLADSKFKPDQFVDAKAPFHQSSPNLSQLSDSGTSSKIPTLATRRSLLRLHKLGASQENLRIPSPIKTSKYDPALSAGTLDSITSPVPRSDSSVPPTTGSSMGDQKKTKSRWNIFSRAKRSQKSPSPAPEIRKPSGHVPVAVANVRDVHEPPHYALLDSEFDEPDSQPGDIRALEEIFGAIEDSPDEDYGGFAAPGHGLGLRSEHGQSILLPSPPNFVSLFPRDSQVTLAGDPLKSETPKAEDLNKNDKPNRLVHIGRIPPVISTRDRERQPPMQSFSRPFASSKLHKREETETKAEERPVLGVQTDPLPSRLFNEPDSANPASAPAVIGRSLPRSPLTQAEFLRYPSWYGSRSSTSSVSNNPRLSGPYQNPRGVRLTRQLSEDEVWKEYDDLIDDVLSPSTTKKNEENDDYFGHQSTEFFPYHENLDPPPSNASGLSPPPLRSPFSSESVRLRRSRIAPALHTSLDGSTPSSLAELVAEYEERNRNSTILLNRMSFLFEEVEEEAENARYKSQDLDDAAATSSNHQRATVLLDIAERYREGPVGLSNLRYGALMISRWLSFSRVLFSPVHNKIAMSQNERILVLDGLGNDDWSYYCAETYNTATIHSLNTMIQPTTSSRDSTIEAWPAPPNHRSVKLTGNTQTFPFPQGFFAVVVFRFPAAMPESTLKRTLGECYRVLRPGGYIEMSVMDLDMVNMGNRTRRAVRMLKVRMNVADAGISLKPASDNMLKIIGRRGFQNLNKCIVSIPVAGIVGSSSIDSSSSRLSQGSTRQDSISAASNKAASFAEPGLIRRSTAESSSASERNFLLSDLIADDSPQSDQRITKMVARVGRWWYTRCYEWAVLPDGDLSRSIWADKKVIQECENRGSGFKLLIAYAQKPLDPRRRTMSEPTPPTLATAGGPTGTISSQHDSI